MTIAPGLMAELLVNERAKETTGEFDQAFRNVKGDYPRMTKEVISNTAKPILREYR